MAEGLARPLLLECDSTPAPPSHTPASPSHHPALDLAEILQQIFEQLDRSRYLARCARVCRSWSREALLVLWKGRAPGDADQWRTPCLQDLAQLIEDQSPRLTEYLSYVRHLDVFRRGKYGCSPRNPQYEIVSQTLKTGVLKKCNSVSVYIDLEPWLAAPHVLQHVVHAQLRLITLADGFFDDKILDMLEGECPKLEAIMVQANIEQVTSARLLKFLQNMPRLKHISGFERKISQRVLLYLASKPGVEYVLLDANATFYNLSWPEVTDYDGPSSFFPALRSLSITSANVDSLRRLLLLLPNIQRLCVGLWVPRGSNEDIMSLFYNCPQLVELDLRLNVAAQPPYSPGPALIQGLTRLGETSPFLRSLELSAFSNKYEMFTLSRPSMWNFVSKLRNIERLSLPFYVSMGLSEFEALSTHCPNLREFFMKRAELCFNELCNAPDRPVLPNLEYAKFYYVTEAMRLDFANYVTLLEMIPLWRQTIFRSDCGEIENCPLQRETVQQAHYRSLSSRSFHRASCWLDQYRGPASFGNVRMRPSRFR